MSSTHSATTVHTSAETVTVVLHGVHGVPLAVVRDWSALEQWLETSPFERSQITTWEIRIKERGLVEPDQLELTDVGRQTGDGPEPAPNPDPEPAFDVPNFNREPGEERTELGASLNELCQRAREAPPAKRPRRRPPGDEQ